MRIAAALAPPFMAAGMPLAAGAESPMAIDVKVIPPTGTPTSVAVHSILPFEI